MTDDQFGTIVGLLAEVRDALALAYLCQPPACPEDDGPPECEHAEWRRTDFSTPREIHWTCGDCGYTEHRRTATHAPAPTPDASAKE